MLSFIYFLIQDLLQKPKTAISNKTSRNLPTCFNETQKYFLIKKGVLKKLVFLKTFSKLPNQVIFFKNCDRRRNTGIVT